ncbi:hypothetical protein D3C71_544890 [compost metagenome]
MRIQMIAAAAVVAGLALSGVAAPAAAGDLRPIKTIESSAHLPGNAIRREHILIKRSLDAFEAYLRMAASTRKDPKQGKTEVIGGTVLKRAMAAQGLVWRDSEEILPRWRMAYILNPAARDAIVSIQTRARAVKYMEKVVARDPAFADGVRNGQLSAKSLKTLRTFLKLGRRFERSFAVFYPLP